MWAGYLIIIQVYTFKQILNVETRDPSFFSPLIYVASILSYERMRKNHRRIYKKVIIHSKKLKILNKIPAIQFGS